MINSLIIIILFAIPIVQYEAPKCFKQTISGIEMYHRIKCKGE